MKSIIMGAQALQPGTAMLTGGFESMSNIPHYLHARTATPLGNVTAQDGCIHDGLWDVYNDQHMGMCGERCATEYGFSRQDQDAYTIETYRRAQQAVQDGVFQEVVPVTIRPRRGDPISIDKDEEPASVKLDKIPTLKPAFDRDNGTVTAANASSLNDGAAAMVLMTEQDALDRDIAPLLKIRGYGEAARDPVDFTTAPSLAVPVALQHAGLQASDVDYHEINEAFAVVALANMHLLGLHHDQTNVFGGAVALGHPIGMSGARIVQTLYNVLREKDGSIGCASICNGGGGASAIVVERMN